MTGRWIVPVLAAFASLGMSGCGVVSGKPSVSSDVPRPEQVLDFETLYDQNCAGCHGADGKNGAAMSLANPVYLAFAGEANLRTATAKGIPRSLMPAFVKNAGGLLTEQQIGVIVGGMLKHWGGDSATNRILPPYTSAATADSSNGSKIFETQCAKCHSGGTLLDPDYLALISNQSLRSMIVAGHRNLHAGWTDQETTDTVAWLAAHRL